MFKQLTNKIMKKYLEIESREMDMLKKIEAGNGRESWLDKVKVKKIANYIKESIEFTVECKELVDELSNYVNAHRAITKPNYARFASVLCFLLVITLGLRVFALSFLENDNVDYKHLPISAKQEIDILGPSGTLKGTREGYVVSNL